MRACFAGVVAFGVLCLAATAAHSEIYAYGYLGKSWSEDADLSVSQPATGTDLTYSGVGFDDHAFESPQYYGAKLGRYFDDWPWLALELEFFHFKIFARTSEVRPVSGTRGGVPVSGSEPVSTTVQTFSISHGVNMLMLNAVGRVGLWKDADHPRGRLQAYSGAGAGLVVNHAESQVNGVFREQYDFDDGPGLQALLGLRCLPFKMEDSDGPAAFVEYKLTYSEPDFDIDRGEGSLDALLTHHVVFGLGWHF